MKCAERKMRKNGLRGIIFIFWAFTLLSFTLDNSNGIRFQAGSLGEVSRLAKDHWKPIFIFVGASYCQLCRKMEKTLADKDVVNFYNSNFICMKMDPTDFGTNLRLGNWGVKAMPAELYLDENRKIFYKASGYMDAAQLLVQGRKAMKLAEKRG